MIHIKRCCRMRDVNIYIENIAVVIGSMLDIRIIVGAVVASLFRALF
jgi:hypothetical protein